MIDYPLQTSKKHVIASNVKSILEMRASRGLLSTAPVQIALVNNDESVNADVKKLARNENWAFQYYSDGRDGLQRISLTRPDIVLIDNRMPDLSGIDCIKKLKCLAPNVPVIILTACADFENIVFSLMAGANGYLIKPISEEHLKDAISRAVHGSVVLCEEAQAAMVLCLQRAFSQASSNALSDRELQIMAGLIQGMADKEISEHLRIAPNTTHVHLTRLFRRMGVHSRSDAIQKFFQLCIGTSCCHCSLPKAYGDGAK
jgi:DNA-binding NarL/FixJ family response regulator